MLHEELGCVDRGECVLHWDGSAERDGAIMSVHTIVLTSAEVVELLRTPGLPARLIEKLAEFRLNDCTLLERKLERKIDWDDPAINERRDLPVDDDSERD